MWSSLEKYVHFTNLLVQQLDGRGRPVDEPVWLPFRFNHPTPLTHRCYKIWSPSGIRGLWRGGAVFPSSREQSSQKLLRKPFPPISGVRKFIPPSKKKKILLTPWRTFSSWWFQPLWKILVKMGFFPKWRVKITNIWSHHPLVDQQQSLSETNCWKSAPTVDSSARSAMHR